MVTEAQSPGEVPILAPLINTVYNQVPMAQVVYKISIGPQIRLTKKEPLVHSQEFNRPIKSSFKRLKLSQDCKH